MTFIHSVLCRICITAVQLFTQLYAFPIIISLQFIFCFLINGIMAVKRDLAHYPGRNFKVDACY